MKDKEIKNYIDKEVLQSALVKYCTMRDYNKENGLDTPTVPEEIGHAFMQIATKLSNRFNFVNYTYKDEMVSDGVLNAISALKSYNPLNEKSNPFGYFTTIIFWAFVRRIKQENTQHEIAQLLMFEDPSFVQQPQDSYDIPTDSLYTFVHNID